MNIKIRCAHDQMIPIGDLKPHPKNRNKHPDEQIVRLAQILEYQGWRQPIKVSRLSGFITAGHGRLLAAQKLGLAEVPVNFQEYESDAQEYADLTADNAIALWAEIDLVGLRDDMKSFSDLDVSLLGLEKFSLDAEKIEGECDEDETPEVPTEPVSRLGDLYELGSHRLLCGDSTNIKNVERLMNGQKAELCFTSPPYADQREYNGGKELATEHLAKFISTAFGKANYFAVNLGYSRKDCAVNRYWDDYIKEAEACGLKLLSWNIWDKGQAGSIGNQTAMFAISHEWIFVFGKETKELNLTEENKHSGDVADHTTIRGSDGTLKKTKSNVVRSHSQMKTILSMFPQKARNHGIEHPAMFPVSFPESYIEAMTNASDGIYEPFGGSGSTLIACEKTKRKCFMMELDPKYIDVIVARWEKFTGKKAQLSQSRADKVS